MLIGLKIARLATERIDLGLLLLLRLIGLFGLLGRLSILRLIRRRSFGRVGSLLG